MLRLDLAANGGAQVIIDRHHIGFDAGTIEVAIDGGPFRAHDLFDGYCEQFHRPQHTLFATDLTPGRHTLVLRVGTRRNPKSTGTAVRILQFLAN